MNKTIFDLGSKNVMEKWWELCFWNDYKVTCKYKRTWLDCFNKCYPWECKHNALLEQFIWTRRMK